jgi:hypothetical protein
MRRRVSKNKTDLNVMYDDIEREREREIQLLFVRYNM